MRTTSVGHHLHSPSLLLAAMVLTVSACVTEEGGPAYYTGAYDYAEVELPGGLLAPGATGQAHLIAYANPGVRLGELEASWSGDNDAVATVTSSGLISAHAEGLAVLSTDVVTHPMRWALYISPASACGGALDVGAWDLEGGFTWHGAATSGDSTIAAHHTAEWALGTEAPRQVSTDEIVWRIHRPTAGNFVLTHRDTLTTGAGTYI
jgi:hypothetical protein